MQKKIIALAVAGLLSGAAFAQTNVTISGVLDAGVANTKGESATGAGLDGSNNAAYNNTATSIIGLKAVESLGGGMNAGAYIETNPLGSNVNAAGVLGDFQRYVFINGGWGELSIGQRTNFSTTTATTAQPFGTAMGGGYSGVFARLQGQAFNAVGAMAGATSGTRDVRAEGSVRYDSPNFSGFTAGFTWKPENDSNNETAASNGHFNLGLNYAGGPLKASYAYAKVTNATAAVPLTTTWVDADADGVIDAGEFANAGGTAAYDSSVKHNLLAANYTFGPVTVYGGYTTSKGSTTAAAGNEFNSRSWNLAAKWAVTGNIDLMANYLKDNDKTAADADRKLFGLGADYHLSKRTAAYVRYEKFDTNTNANLGERRTYAAGLRHSF